MTKLYNQSVISDSFVIGWHSSDIKSDKKCKLYDRKTEKAFRPLLDKFVDWLKSADYGEEYGEEETKEEQPQTEEPSQADKESEQQKQQRMMIEAQKQAQDELIQKAKAKAEMEETKE